MLTIPLHNSGMYEIWYEGSPRLKEQKNHAQKIMVAMVT